MGVSTKLFVGGRNDSREVMAKVVKVLSQYIRDEANKEMKKGVYNNIHHFMSLNKDNWTNGIYPIEVTPCFRMYSLYFKLRGESRRLAIFDTCNNDYNHIYDGDKIIFDLSHWGSSHEIMMVVADVLKEYGIVFYIESDCSGDFVELFKKEEV